MRSAKPDMPRRRDTDNMHLFGLVTLGYMWLLQAKAAREKLKAGANGSPRGKEAKLTTARFFMERMLPRPPRASPASPPAPTRPWRAGRDVLKLVSCE